MRSSECNCRGFLVLPRELLRYRLRGRRILTQGIGPTTARKMKEAGISSVMELATAIPEELATDLGGSKETAATFIMAAQKLLRESGILDNEFTTADIELEKRKSLLRCSTGSRSLDELLLGGIETQA